MTAAVMAITPMVVWPGMTAIVKVTVKTMPYIAHAAAISDRLSPRTGVHSRWTAAGPAGMSAVIASSST
jgi:hypothetical protein